MKLTDQAINEFEAIWLTEHPGEKMDREKLIDMATRVLVAVDSTYKEIPKGKF